MALLEINKNPSKRELAWVGALFALFFGLIGAISYWRFHAPERAFVFWAVGVGLCLLYYAVPPIRRSLYIGWMYAAYPIGWTISHLLLGITYYLVLTPIGLIMRLVRKDPLQRRFESETESYWSAHSPDTDPSRYFRQF
jgi:hypothetical protein